MKRAEKGIKRFSLLVQLVARPFCQLEHVDFTKGRIGELGICMAKLRHLSIKVAPKRSPLSYGKNHRPDNCRKG